MKRRSFLGALLGLFVAPLAIGKARFSFTWWRTSTVTGINAEAAGWHLAQGWRITDIDYDESTTPPTPYYAMTKESLNNAIVLQDLLNRHRPK